MSHDFESDQEYDQETEYEIARQSQSQRVRELEELMQLAELSAENVDKLSDAVDHSKTQGWKAAFVVSLLMALLSGGLTILSNKDLQFSTYLYYTLFACVFLIVVVVALVAMVVFTRAKRTSRLRRSLIVEIDIHHRLISMIDQQLQRVIHSGEFSPVHRAIIDIKVRRMMRY